MAAARGWKAYPGLAAAKQAKKVYGPQQMQKAKIMTTTILDTSLSAFWVDSDSFCCKATCDWQTEAVRHRTLSSGYSLCRKRLAHAYGSDSHPHCNVAQDDDCQRDDTAGDHEGDHVGLDSRVVAAAEHIRSAGGLQSMRPVPDARRYFVVAFYLFSIQKQDAHQATCSIRRLDTHTSRLAISRRTRFPPWPICHQTWHFQKACTRLSIAPRRWWSVTRDQRYLC